MSNQNKMIEFYWKPLSEIPTEHWENNYAISPLYLVKCDGLIEGQPVIGYANYSFATNEWMSCFHAIGQGVYEVIAWTDVKL